MVEGHDRGSGGQTLEVRAQPRELRRIQVAVVPKVGDIDRVQPDEVDAAKGKGIVVRPEPLTVHALAVQRVRSRHQRQVALDAEVLVVAGHAPDWHRKATSLIEVQIVVATRLVLADAKRVTHEIAGHEDEIGTPSLGDSPKLLQTNEALRTDVRVRRVDERERRRGRAGGQGKVQGRAARR